MHTKSDEIRLLASKWNELIEREKLSLSLSDLDFSALSSWVVDCSESYQEIYSDLLEKIRMSDPHDYDLRHDCVVDIFWHLDHLREHITAAEKGFVELMRLLALKAEKA
jgi:hypothetical protein